MKLWPYRCANMCTCRLRISLRHGSQPTYGLWEGRLQKISWPVYEHITVCQLSSTNWGTFPRPFPSPWRTGPKWGSHLTCYSRPCDALHSPRVILDVNKI